MYPVPLLRTPLPPNENQNVYSFLFYHCSQSPVACYPKVGSKRLKEYVESFYFT